MGCHTHGPYRYTWSKLHWPKSHLEPLRQEYDELGSAALGKLQELSRTQTSSTSPPERTDLLALLKQFHPSDHTLSAFWHELNTVPEWVDWAQLARGQHFFYRYAPANLMGFALQGFVGENSAAAGVVEVLTRTGGFSTRVLFRRLLETFQLVLQVTDFSSPVDSHVGPGGAAWETAIRVRLLHASVRNRILKLASAKEGYYDTAKYGVPVNTLDSIHSISTFCCNHMWLQLPQQGVYPSLQETADYIALWRYVGYLLATPTDEYFSTVERAKATMESMLMHEHQITQTAVVLGHNFVECLRDLPPFNVSAQFIEAGSRMLNGDGVCDALGFDFEPSWYHYASWRGYCWLVRALAALQQSAPSGVDEIIVRWWRNTLHGAVIQSHAGLAGGSKMDFKYVPPADQLTGKEGNGRSRLPRSPLYRPVEAIYLAVWFSGVVMMAIVAAVLVSTLQQLTCFIGVDRN
ncbi:uncharacterized protein B0I36DRAFT_377845 [Microdochium trichocladiopsis]|uniref:ER-bound oxygenase mpaB/mpaB'/Rubber oxygenase catalytic domain-containing protein n=1 Tax=Microdochium trichocladiopsis TaxID=1682393 RepID=A0A9P8XUN6_9PEZI|nr:uncharacterized protein B0I36DRAFT_377845 [Microdochium trichocladiopsis]KAH7016259.1 hypothetical protein B0I36DRAFT_377845 [Microdochium trichocladiopsis]